MEKEKRIRITIDLPMKFPEDWNDRSIEFYLNESSWCSDNFIDELEQYSEEHGCICSICKAMVLNDEES